MNDEQLLQHLRDGREDKALAVLYRHLPPIRRMIRHLGGNREEAEDIFQESLIILCRRALEPGFRLQAGLYPFLHSVCRLLWLSELRRQQRLPLTSGAADEEQDVYAAEVRDLLEEEARYRLAEAAISQLGDRCRELLQLFYSAGIKLQDIARRMGYGSEQSAKNQKYKCLEAARGRYRQQQIHHS